MLGPGCAAVLLLPAPTSLHSTLSAEPGLSGAPLAHGVMHAVAAARGESPSMWKTSWLVAVVVAGHCCVNPLGSAPASRVCWATNALSVTCSSENSHAREHGSSDDVLSLPSPSNPASHQCSGLVRSISSVRHNL